MRAERSFAEDAVNWRRHCKLKSEPIENVHGRDGIVIGGAPQRARSQRTGETPAQSLYLCGGSCHASMEGQSIMTDDPVELDEHRGMAAQKSTEIRRRLHQVQADQAALRRRQEEFERHALAAPSTTWAEAAAEARYLILLFAETSEARNPRRQELIAKVLDDLARLSD
jgi:hypothetical protein